MKTQAQIEATIEVYEKRLADFKEKAEFHKDFMKAGQFTNNEQVYVESCKSYWDYKNKESRTQARIEILRWVLDN